MIETIDDKKTTLLYKELPTMGTYSRDGWLRIERRQPGLLRDRTQLDVPKSTLIKVDDERDSLIFVEMPKDILRGASNGWDTGPIPRVAVQRDQ